MSLILSKKTSKQPISTTSRLQSLPTKLKVQPSGKTQCIASSVQQRIWLHERLHFSNSELSVYNIVFPIIIKHGLLSIEYFRSCLLRVIDQHTVLRTAINFNSERNQIEQCVQPADHDLYSFERSCGVRTSNHLDYLLTRESTMKHFEIEKGRVVRCHVIQRSDDEDDQFLHEGDIVAIAFHHIAFDNTSLKAFIKAFEKACKTDEHQQSASLNLQYIDFTLYEQVMINDSNSDSKLNRARRFWSDVMRGYNWNRIPNLIPNADVGERVRSGRGYSTSFVFDHSLVDAMMQCASTNNVTMFSLTLACYYAFLFKLTNGEEDLCVASVTANRPEQEMQDMIGMFANLLPYRFKIEPNDSFLQLIQKVQKLSGDILEHASLPYQEILNLNGDQEHHGLPSTLFQYESLMSSLTQKNRVEITTQGGAVLGVYFDRDRSHGNGVASFDLTLTITHDHYARTTECFIDCSADIFENQANVDIFGNRFQHMLCELFCSSMTIEPIYKLSIILPHEQKIINQLENRKSNITSLWPFTIHEKFIEQAQLYSQKIVLELDQQLITYSELLDRTRRLATHLSHKVQQEEIVCQCVERSIEMVIGLLAILSTGAVYCPLSSTDPPTRLATLVRETRSTVVLVHSFTYETFLEADISCDLIPIDSFLISAKDNSNDDCRSTRTTSDKVAYIIFTSGTTGTPKAVVISHSSLLYYLQSSVEVDALRTSDIAVQLSASTWDVHLHEILGTLFVGGSIVLLRPEQGNKNMDYLGRVIEAHQVTYVCIVPTLQTLLFDILQAQKAFHRLSTLRLLWSVGEPIPSHLIARMLSILPNGCQYINFGGATEGTVAQTIRIITESDAHSSSGNVPLGRSMPYFGCHVLDKFYQPIPFGYTGMFYISGPIMNGYLNRPELDAKVLISLPNKSGKMYKTGDLARLLVESGEIQLLGRDDFQVKFHGQRVELGEIEAAIYRSNSTICNCAVIKVVEKRREHLLAYIQLNTHDVAIPFDQKQVRSTCQNYLPHWMVPSHFILIPQLPINANGKLDRKALPKSDLSLLNEYIDSTEEYSEDDLLMSGEQQHVHDLWCRVLQINDKTKIPVNCSFFSMGGNSLAMMRLYAEYQKSFQVDSQCLPMNISCLFRQSTISQHALLLRQWLYDTSQQKATQQNQKHNQEWRTLNIVQAEASYAQQRIFLDQLVRFSNDTALYNVPLIYRVQSDDNNGKIPFDRLRRAIKSMIVKHTVLRTSLQLDDNTGLVIQRINPLDDHEEQYKFCISHAENDEQIIAALNEEIKNPTLFDLSHGIVLRCHVIVTSDKQIISGDQEEYSLKHGDILIFNLHHIAFDGASRRIFFHDLKHAFETDAPLPLGEDAFHYIDYSVLERRMDMTSSRAFWRSHLKEYDFSHRLPLPIDRYESSTENRSGLAHLVEFQFGDDLSDSFIKYASAHDVTPFQLGLATFYAFLFKLTNNRTDLCTSCIYANRYRTELADIIGMFVATLPHRIQIDSSISFAELVNKIRSQFLSIMEHMHYPLQNILAESEHKQLSAGFLQTLFDFVTYSKDVDLQSLEGTTFYPVPLKQMEQVVKFDLKLLFFYDSTTTNNISCSLICSRDVFDLVTVEKLSRQFQHMLSQLFMEYTIAKAHDKENREPISKLSLILPEEAKEIQRKNFYWMFNIGNRAPASYAQSRIYHEICQSSSIYYNMSFIYRLSSVGTLSTYSLRRALQHLIVKHESLRTALIFDTSENILMQQITDITSNDEQLFTIIESTFQTEDELDRILKDEQYNEYHFDLVEGRVFRCHVVYYKEIPHTGHITNQDIIIFNFHPALFDIFSLNIFLRHFEQVYVTDDLTLKDDCLELRYIDYAVAERKMPMTTANQFWTDTLKDCEIDCQISLPFDRHRVSTDQRSDRIASTSFYFGDDLSQKFLEYAVEQQITPKHLALASYFLFLLHLTNGERDICIGIDTDGRCKPELRSIIGTFANRIPLRCRIDHNWSFLQLVKYVHEIAVISEEYSYYPLERMLNQYPLKSKATFINISFNFDSMTSKSECNDIKVSGLCISRLPYPRNIDTEKIVGNMDFKLDVRHDIGTNKLSCSIHGSLDLFSAVTVEKIAQRFHWLVQALFDSRPNQLNQPIYGLSLILPEEHFLIDSISNNQVLIASGSFIHHEVAAHANNHPQKIAIELDEQCLTYSELLYCAQWLAVTLLKEHNIKPGDIICQYVDRSVTMVIGVISIVMAGGSYCPLSTLDPPQRRQLLVNQTHCHLLLVHSVTRAKVGFDIAMFDIEAAIIANENSFDIDLDQLYNVFLTPENIAFVIFTSGSTGIPKAVQLRHRNFTEFMGSFVHAGILSKIDTIVQMARCSFDNHLLSLVGTLVVGGTLVMLRPEGNMDFDYLVDVLNKKQVTVMHAVPSLLRGIFTYLKETKRTESVKWLRCLCSGGETLNFKTTSLLKSQVKETCRIRNQYGPAELTINCLSNLVHLREDGLNLPLGRLLPNFYCFILDEFLQPICIGHEGELLVGGVGVFPGYYGRDDLTAKALININGKIVYRTGDLVRMDQEGLIHYISRKDFQVKLRGQRIELGEIERCLLETSATATIVTKWGEDHVIAYVQGSNISVDQLREHCRRHLPPFMVPSLFVIVEQFPLSVNGKVDRKRLPPPDFKLLSSSNIIDQENSMPKNDFESRVHSLWCEILHRTSISRVESIFSIGGHSLLLIQLYQRYKTIFDFNIHTLSITKFFQYPTISDHARLICQSMKKTVDNDLSWKTLHLIEAPLSYAQERIVFDEHLRFSTKHNSMYTILMAYRIQNDNRAVSIERLHRALNAVLTKHKVLRTVISSDMTGMFRQFVLNITDYCDNEYIYGVTTFDINDDENIKSLYDKVEYSKMFDLTKGQVLHCYFLRHRRNLSQNTNYLTHGDAFIIAVHHSVFDGFSTPIFLRDFCLAYETNGILSMDNDLLQYIDYSVHERLINMDMLRNFWHMELNGYDLARWLPLPVDRRRVLGSERSGLSCIAEFSFGEDLSRLFLDYASSHHVTLFQLGLASFYAFLFKLCNNDNDLCVAGINANRYRGELRELIGMFVTTLPYRIQIDGNCSFDQLVEQVSNRCLSILEHSQYPLQRIVADSHHQQSNTPFLETVFDFITIAPGINQLTLDDTQLQRMVALQADAVAKFDFLCTFVHNPSFTNSIMTCSLVCSRDVFDQSKVEVIARRFEQSLHQLFLSKVTSGQNVESIHNLSIILPEELVEMRCTVFRRLLNTTNEAPASYAQARIWLDERIRFDSEKSKVAIYNMPFLHRLAPDGTLSIPKLRHALQLVVMKHVILRTSLYFDTEKNLLMQRVMEPREDEELFSFIESVFETDEDLDEIMHNERGNPFHFNLLQGLACRCHVIYHKKISEEGILGDKDALIFNFHHALFDFPSMSVFRRDLDQAYKVDYLNNEDIRTLRYLDYAIAEQQMTMTAASAFWLDALRDCEIDRPLPLPFDRYRVSDESRTGRGTSITFHFDTDLSQAFLSYAFMHNIKLEHLALATYYILLFKLTNGEKDICIVMNTHGRYKPELMSVIGMFVNAIPMRCRFDPHYSLLQFAKHVQTVAMNSLEHSYFPLQHILAQHPLVSRPAFLDTFFGFVSCSDENSCGSVTLGDVKVITMPYSTKVSTDEIASKFDFSLNIVHDSVTNLLSCKIEASLDLFDPITVQKVGQRYLVLLRQLFVSNMLQQAAQSLYEMSLTFPDERLLIQSINNTQVSFPFVQPVHHEFFCQANEKSQKVAVELDEQFLTYDELLYYAQQLALQITINRACMLGDAICQCVERSISMIIGILSIVMIGGVYCPLSPRDPKQRLLDLIEQTQSNLVLTNWRTQEKFANNSIALNIDAALHINEVINDIYLQRILNVRVALDSIAYVIFTSGSTGKPKAVQMTHRNLSSCMASFNHLNIMNKHDIVIQMAQCTFDVHVKECLGTLLIGASLVLLNPDSWMDHQYLSKTLQQHTITFFSVVPSMMVVLFNYITSTKQVSCLASVTKYGFLGEAIDSKTIAKMVKYIDSHTTAFYNLYGPAECTLTSVYHRTTIHEITHGAIPIGIPFPNMEVHSIDAFGQSVIIGQEAELLIGGVGLFAGYLGRDDLTAKALIEINGRKFYRTGDLVRMDINGLLHYIGRKDHQVKVHGQRIELDEIQRCLLDTSISACVVIKWDNDHLIAYVQSDNESVEQLREHCRSRLPSFMVPSMFIVLEKFPLNANGKLDRQRLPKPEFASLMKTNETALILPCTPIEKTVLSLWCEILHCDDGKISTNSSFFSVGGHSLLFIQLYHRYQTLFCFNNELLPITLFLNQTNIVEHAKLIESIKNKQNDDTIWQALHITEGIASFAQERIFLDEQLRFKDSVSVYNELTAFILTSGVLSSTRLQRAIISVLEKHQVLRTRLILDTDHGTLAQSVTCNHSMFLLDTEKIFHCDNELDSLLLHTKTDPKLFDLSVGRVFHCQVLRHHSNNENTNKDLICQSDVLVFAFHHAAFDRASRQIFFLDLNIAYEQDKPFQIKDDIVQYIDYSVYERQMNMSSASEFWRAQLDGYDLERQLILSVDRYRLTNNERSGYTVITKFSLNDKLSQSFLASASTYQVTPFQLGLALFYTFMFKLTNGVSDLCVACINANRYRFELQNLIGMFVATLPYRMKVKPYCSFEQLVQQVREKCFSIVEHSHYPLQNIFADLHNRQSTNMFLENVFDFVSLETASDSMNFCNSSFESVPSQQLDTAAKFDWLLTFYENSSATQDDISVALICSQDLFDQNSIDTLGARFLILIEQLLGCDQPFLTMQPISHLSINLPADLSIIDQLMGIGIEKTTQANVTSNMFTQQAENYSQKLAIVLDEQSLTYNELLFYVQRVATDLIEQHHVRHGETICQCMERTLSMVIGSLAIQMTGAVYCPLSPQDPKQRLKNLLQQTACRLVLIHSKTISVFDNETTIIDIDTMINANKRIANVDLERLASVSVTPNSISYIIFTSGSTGIPKVVQVRHRNITENIQSFVQIGTLNRNDTVVQMASCSFDNHIQDIIGTLMVGASLIMLHQQGNVDLTYFVDQLIDKEVTFMDSVPSYLGVLSDYIETHKLGQCLGKLRTICSGGEVLPLHTISQLKKYVTCPLSTQHGCRLWNFYGPAEATISSTYFQIDFGFDKQIIPIGQPLPNYTCIILDEFLQPIVTGQEGELFIGGVGIFAGYLNRADLTAKTLIEIDNKVFYRTGDLVRSDITGLIYYIGRKDHQVKLRGQRIELAEVEKCILNMSSRISGCVVIKWSGEKLIAYVQCTDLDEVPLQNHCRSHLPPYMVPSKCILLEQFPLNTNGKLDRKRLPEPNFSVIKHENDNDVPSNPLEKQLQDIFSQAFQIKSPNLGTPFGEFGGTSLNVIVALALIRQQVCTNVDMGLLLNNQSIRQLTHAIESLIVSKQSQDININIKRTQEISVLRASPSLTMESLGIICLMFQWLWPIIMIAQRCPHLLLAIPFIHLSFYVICSRLLAPPSNKAEHLFSWNYYQWWFLDRLWISNTYWLKYVLGTPFYNYYLRLCGARISLDAHIYTTAMDAPYLLDIGNETWIADQTLLNCLSYHDNDTFELNAIKIGSACSISTRSILFGGVNMQENTIVQPMSSVTGYIAAQTLIDGDEHNSLSFDIFNSNSHRSLSVLHKIYQFIVIILLISIHSVLLISFYQIYYLLQLPLPIGVAFCWILWSITGSLICLILLKYAVGSCNGGEKYSITSWKYLHNLWLRQLVVSSFSHALLLSTSYDYIYPFILRWLGAYVEDNVKISEIETFLSFPTNLLKIKKGATTFGSVLMVPTELTMSGYHHVDYITLGTYTNFGNGCSILPGSCLASDSMVGNLTRVSRATDNKDGAVFIGIPARSMPFSMPTRSDKLDQIEIIPFWFTCLTYGLSKCLLLGIYWVPGLFIGLILHTAFVCCFYRWSSYIRNRTINHIAVKLWRDHQLFVCPFLGNTQVLIHLFRAFGACIGQRVIIPDFACLTDYELVTIGDHVRFNIFAHIQCHSFEQRIKKVATVMIGNSSILMSGSFVLAGSKLMGTNRLYPYTIIMKNEQLPPNSNWKGVPARYVSVNTKPNYSPNVPAQLDAYDQVNESFDESNLRYEWITSNYANSNEVQFMNCGYADLDQHIDTNYENCSIKLYEKILGNVLLDNRNVAEIGCGNGVGAAWCTRKYALHSYTGVDMSPGFIHLCRRFYSIIAPLSFIQADARKRLPFEDQSVDVVLCVETTHAFGGSIAMKNFVAEVTRILRPNGYLLWCDLCYMDEPKTLVDHLESNSELIIEEKSNITRNVLRALEVQSKPRTDVLERIVKPNERENFRLLAKIPGTKIYDEMRQGRIQYWRVVLRKMTGSHMAIPCH